MNSQSTGTKCISKSSMNKNGDILNDSHAEVMCRRGFLRYIFKQLDHAITEIDSIFSFNAATKKFEISEKISFHFFTTHAPCGDASIYSTSKDHTEPEAKRPKLESNSDDESIGNCLSSTEANFTGAKIIYKSTDVAPDLMVQSIGEIRTKPGRGEPTLSISCSDKLAKWNVLGLQGALIYSLLDKPIYLDSVTLCNSKFCNIEATERAIWKRFENEHSFTSDAFTIKQPTVQMCDDAIFKSEKRNEREPAAGSIVWCKTIKYPHQVAVNGKRLGVTKKKANTLSGRLFISKIELFRCYLDILKKFNEKLSLYPNDMNFDTLRYCDAKNASIEYQSAWNSVKQKYFGIWSTKPDELKTFTID